MLQIYHCVQLNVLFCCLWRNVEASCHKHFVVFSRNQHRHLLPARRWPSSNGDRVDNTWLVAALTHAVRPDIGSESRLLPIPPAFDAPVRGFPSDYCHAIWRRKTRMVWPTNGEKKLMLYLFILTQFTNVTCRQTYTHRQTDTA